MLRLDKWLWAARFYKTRSLATDEINKGRVEVNAQVVKPAREVKVGDFIQVAIRTNNRRVVQVQNCRNDGTTYGTQATVHAATRTETSGSWVVSTTC